MLAALDDEFGQPFARAPLAGRFARAAMQFDDLGAARFDVQSVHVLRDDGGQVATALQFSQRIVPGIRPHVLAGPEIPRRTLPGAHAGFAVIHEVLVHDRRLRVPYAVRATVIRDAAIGADARAGERHAAARHAHQVGEGFHGDFMGVHGGE